jgi:hypothetical protein
MVSNRPSLWSGKRVKIISIHYLFFVRLSIVSLLIDSFNGKMKEQTAAFGHLKLKDRK